MLETGNRVSFDTARTVLVPAPLYEKGVEKEYLHFNGMTLAAGEVAVASEPREGIVAVMGVSADLWSRYEHEYKRDEVRVTSPLLDMAAKRGHGPRRGRCVDILLTAENIYIVVWDDVLRMAEVFPDNSVDSLLYYTQVVGRRFNLRKFDINVGGEGAGHVANTLRCYYKKVRAV